MSKNISITCELLWLVVSENTTSSLLLNKKLRWKNHFKYKIHREITKESE